MGSIKDDLVVESQKSLSEKGRLSTAIASFSARPEQITLATAIAQTILEQSTLVAEAGTGTGKTFAYLIPCLLSGKKILLSTATKTLQDQLFHKDLPTLIRALGLSARVQNLKGRSNYICLHRTQLHAEEGRFIHAQCSHEILHIREKIPQLTAGERSELPEISENSLVWPYVTSTVDNCLGSDCEFHQDCFLVKARKRALDANIVVVNHYLFFADSRLKDEGFGELLPGVDVVIFDEAHQLAEIATQFHAEHLSLRQIKDLVDDLIREWPVIDLPNRPFKHMSLNLDQIIDQLMISLASKTERFLLRFLLANKLFIANWQSLLLFIEELLVAIEESGQLDNNGVKRCHKKLIDYQRLARRLLNNDNQMIRWIELFKHTFVYHETPFNVATTFREFLLKQQCAYVFASATLTMSTVFDCFTKPLGLTEAKTLYLSSPFDYEKQALLYLPRGIPDPKHARYYDYLIEKAIPIIEACGGRCFFLFTSHRALKLVAQQLTNNLNYPLLIQGDEAKPILLARFRQLGNAVLLGTSTFWEGVDVKGEALSCVIIDKLPFSNPVDPVIRGKMDYYKSQGLSGFDELSLPNAILSLKQGVGRLIRDVTDKGVLMIADPRLTGREYGRHVFASLPKMRKTRDQQIALNFISELFL